MKNRRRQIRDIKSKSLLHADLQIARFNNMKKLSNDPKKNKRRLSLLNRPNDHFGKENYRARKTTQKRV